MTRGLSGMYYDQPVCFEEMSREQQEETLETLNMDQLKHLALVLANTLNYVAETCGFVKLKGNDDS